MGKVHPLSKYLRSSSACQARGNHTAGPGSPLPPWVIGEIGRKEESIQTSV